MPPERVLRFPSEHWCLLSRLVAGPESSPRGRRVCRDVRVARRRRDVGSRSAHRTSSRSVGTVAQRRPTTPRPPEGGDVARSRSCRRAGCERRDAGAVRERASRLTEAENSRRDAHPTGKAAATAVKTNASDRSERHPASNSRRTAPSRSMLPSSSQAPGRISEETSWLCPASRSPRQCEGVALPEQAINRGHSR